MSLTRAQQIAHIASLITDPYNEQNSAARVREAFLDIIQNCFNLAEDGVSGVKGNFNATAAPTANNDSTQNYSKDSTWIFGNDIYKAKSVDVGAAVWVLASTPATNAAFATLGGNAIDNLSLVNYIDARLASQTITGQSLGHFREGITTTPIASQNIGDVIFYTKTSTNPEELWMQVSDGVSWVDKLKFDTALGGNPLVQDLTNPNATDVLSTQGVVNAIAAIGGSGSTDDEKWIPNHAYAEFETFTIKPTQVTPIDKDGNTLQTGKVYNVYYEAATTSSASLTLAEIAKLTVVENPASDIASQALAISNNVQIQINNLGVINRPFTPVLTFDRDVTHSPAYVQTTPLTLSLNANGNIDGNSQYLLFTSNGDPITITSNFKELPNGLISHIVSNPGQYRIALFYHGGLDEVWIASSISTSASPPSSNQVALNTFLPVSSITSGNAPYTVVSVINSDAIPPATGYTITGADASKFDVQSLISGDFNLRAVQSLDFANPSDANSDNLYDIKLQAQNSEGTQIVPSDFQISVLSNNAITAPSEPLSLVASATSDTTIDLSWSVPLSDGGSIITGYKIERESPTGGGFTTIVASTGNQITSYSDTGLTSGKDYNYKVSAINAIGTGSFSNESSATTSNSQSFLVKTTSQSANFEVTIVASNTVTYDIIDNVTSNTIATGTVSNNKIAADLTSSSGDASIIVSDKSQITDFRCIGKSISDISINTQSLMYLHCENNLISNLDVSNCSGLIELYFYSNNISNINTANNIALKKLYGYNNGQLSAVNLSTNVDLTHVLLNNCNLNSIDTSLNTKLFYYKIGGNSISTIDLSANTLLQYLYAEGNSISTIDLSNNTALKVLQVENNNISTLDVSSNVSLTRIQAYNNTLSSFNLSTNTALQYLYVQGCNLSSLDITNNTALKTVICDNNSNLGTISLAGLSSITYLKANNCKIAALDLSGLTALTTCLVNSNNLSSLNVKNGNNSSMAVVDFRNQLNSTLTCILVDNVAYSNTNWSTKIDAATSFSDTTC